MYNIFQLRFSVLFSVQVWMGDLCLAVGESDSVCRGLYAAQNNSTLSDRNKTPINVKKRSLYLIWNSCAIGLLITCHLFGVLAAIFGYEWITQCCHLSGAPQLHIHMQTWIVLKEVWYVLKSTVSASDDVSFSIFRCNVLYLSKLYASNTFRADPLGCFMFMNILIGGTN